MTGRTPACEDAAVIAARLAEIQRERMAAISGCICPAQGPTQRDTNGNIVHAPTCPLRQAAADVAVVRLGEAMERMRARVNRNLAAEMLAKHEPDWAAIDALTDDDIERQIAADPDAAPDMGDVPQERWTSAAAEKAARHRVPS